MRYCSVSQTLEGSSEAEWKMKASPLKNIYPSSISLYCLPSLLFLSPISSHCYQLSNHDEAEVGFTARRRSSFDQGHTSNMLWRSSSTDKVCAEEGWRRRSSCALYTLPKGRGHPAPWFRLLAMFYRWSFYYGKRYLYPDTQVSTFPITFPLAQKLSASQRTILQLLSAAFLKSKSLCKAMKKLDFYGGGCHFM